MSEFLQVRFGWTDLLFAAILLFVGYLLLQFISQRLKRKPILGRFTKQVEETFSAILLLYEPISILLLGIILLFINPLPHGILLLLIITAGFSRLRDYFSGRVLLFKPLVKQGKRMKTGKFTGVITQINRLGLYLQTSEGLHFVNYSSLLTEGYSLVTGKEYGGYYQLNITAPDSEKEAHPFRFLEDKFLTTPYLDRSFRPELFPGDSSEHRIKARISVREEKHLRELLTLMEEWGYPATVAKK